MAYFSSISEHVITLRAIVVTEANVIQLCIDPVQSSTWTIQANNLNYHYRIGSVAPCDRDELMVTITLDTSLGSRDGAVVRALASHQCGVGSIPVRCHMWVEFVVGSRLALRVFSGFSGFPSSTKTNISKFQFAQDREPA